MIKIDKTRTMQKSGLRGYVIGISELIYSLVGMKHGDRYTLMEYEGGMIMLPGMWAPEKIGGIFIAYGSCRIDGKMSLPIHYVQQKGWVEKKTKFEKYVCDWPTGKVIKLINV